MQGFDEAKTKIRSNMKNLCIIFDFLFFVVSSDLFVALLLPC